MASLYRKYRPEHFAELVGQESVTDALRNAVREGRTGHAYLFSGPRGTGKTTTARILARALNCLELADGEPCGKCANCVSIGANAFFDFMELDAASNSGVGEMRELIKSVHLGVGVENTRNRVYIVDEVHMLSKEASNALLKTLEEPPAHVVFVLATTDPQKVLPTIRSRTQHFEFKLLSHKKLVEYLGRILGWEEIGTDDQTLDLITRRAGGSVRDALSLLDQALAVGNGNLDNADVHAALSGVPFEQRVAVLDAAAAEDVAGVLVGVHEMMMAGHDSRRVADDLLRTLRDAFLCANAAGRVPYDGPVAEAERLTDLAQRIGNVALVRGIEVLGQAIVDIRGQAISDPRLVLEVSVVRLARRESRTREETLLDRIERLERQVGSGGAPLVDPPRVAPKAEAAPAAAAPPPARDPKGPMLSARAPAKRAAPQTEPQPAEPEVPAAVDTTAADIDVTFDIDAVILAWPLALEALKAPVRGVIVEAQPIGIERGAIVFGAPRKRFEAIQTRFRSEAPAIKAALASHLGAEPKIIVRPHDFEATDALKPVTKAAAGTPAEAPAVEEPPEENIDLEQLTDAPDERRADPAEKLAGLGAQVVEEHPRG